MSAKAAVTSEGSSASKFTHEVAGRTRLLPGCWTEGLSSSWAVGQRCSPAQALALWTSP